MVSIGTILVNYPQQTFNDALYSLEQATKLNKNSKPFQYWKYCTWSIISSMISLESYLGSYIDVIKEDIGKPYWVNYEKASVKQTKSKGVFSKIKFVELISNSEIMDQNDLEWQNIANSIKLRNDIVHYRVKSIFNQLNDTNANNAINACRSMIKKFHNAIDINYLKSASWIDKTQSEDYD